MIREVDTLAGGATPGLPTAPVAFERATPPWESVEQEIARLTWLVLDGHASLGERQRLAELVKHQHNLRRRLPA